MLLSSLRFGSLCALRKLIRVCSLTATLPGQDQPRRGPRRACRQPLPASARRPGAFRPVRPAVATAATHVDYAYSHSQVSKASNRIHCDDFVWFPSTTRSVLGISSMEFYLHTNRAVRHSLCPQKKRANVVGTRLCTLPCSASCACVAGDLGAQHARRLRTPRAGAQRRTGQGVDRGHRHRQQQHAGTIPFLQGGWALFRRLHEMCVC